MTQAKIGIIGGSGLYQMPELKDIDEIELETPFGSPSDKFILGTLEGERVAFLPRHGRGHRFTPTEVPFRANIYGMKLLGVERILSASAVGSLQEKYAPLDMVIPDQFFDRTRARPRINLLWRRHRRACGVCTSGVRPAGRHAGAGLPGRRRESASGRNLHLHGRAGVFDRG